jgi:hypothetical protein
VVKEKPVELTPLAPLAPPVPPAPPPPTAIGYPCTVIGVALGVLSI